MQPDTIVRPPRTLGGEDLFQIDEPAIAAVLLNQLCKVVLTLSLTLATGNAKTSSLPSRSPKVIAPPRGIASS